MSEARRKPNFLVVGAAKAGTTALYYFLKQHPEIAFSELKEPKYFSSRELTFPHQGTGDASVDKFAIRTEAEYYQLFEALPSATRTGEISPDYLYFSHFTAKAIREELGDIPIIAILRDPVKRAFSAYTYLVRDNREQLSFLDSVAQEEERLSQNWDFIWGYKQGGHYADQLKPFFEHFSQVKVVFQEDLTQDSESLVKDLFAFLGVDQGFTADTSTQHNASGKPKNAVAKLLLNRDSAVGTFLRETAKRVVPRRLLEKAANSSMEKLHITPEEDAQLRPYFREQVEALENLLQKDLSHWK